MKVLIGVCGIGFGHSTRQLEMAKALMARGIEVRILTFGKGSEYFKNAGIRNYSIYVPWIAFKGQYLDLITTIKKNAFSYIPGKVKNRKVLNLLLDEGFIPDVCITDYEPTVAKIAYKLDKPLILIDQQSKFWYYDFEPIEGYNCVEERKRMNIFFPRFTKRFIVSFYNLPVPDNNNIQLIPPIIKSEIVNSNISKYNRKTILVYFSAYGSESPNQYLQDIIMVFDRLTYEYDFIIYCDDVSKIGNSTNKNIIIKSINRHEFVEDLKACHGVISTAGHTLISEALFLEIPIYVLPLPTFDQHYCGNFINENNLGYSSSTITYEEVFKFLHNLDYFAQNIKQSRVINYDKNPIDTIVNYLEGLYENSSNS